VVALLDVSNVNFMKAVIWKLFHSYVSAKSVNQDLIRLICIKNR